MRAAAPPLTPRAQQLADRVDRVVARAARHWLGVLGAIVGVMTALPFAAAMLRASGHAVLARPIDLGYRLICHQRTDRSFHLAGEPMSFCQRDLAIFASTLALVVAFALAREQLSRVSTSLRQACWLAVPMLIDGGSQLTGLRESTWELRVTTGALFAVGIGLWALPRLDNGFNVLRREIDARLAAGAPSTKVTT